MATDPCDSDHMQLKQSESIYQIDNLGNLISELLNEVSRLPQELIFETLVRLPVKSLLRFKCVSKSWLCLISSPQFVSSHFSISSSEADRELNSQVLIVPELPFSPVQLLPPSSVAIKQISLNSALYEVDPSAYVSEIDYPNRRSYKDNEVVGIINGLVCLEVKRSFFLWNPALRNYKLLPISNVTLKEYFFWEYGFGYDESNDDYKVVLLLSDIVTVYSLINDSWRFIDNCKIQLPLDGSGKYANGKIHWLVDSSRRKSNITSLDMATDKFGELQLPEYEAGVSGNMVFGVSNERLLLLCKYYDLKKMDLWVMEEYGVEESWSKVVSIPYDILYPVMSPRRDDYTPQIVCILRNGEIVVSNGWDFIVYDSMHKDFRKIELGGQRTCTFHVYVESLVFRLYKVAQLRRGFSFSFKKNFRTMIYAALCPLL